MRPLLKGRSKGRPVEGKYWLGRCGPSFKTGRRPFFLGLLRFRIALCGRPLFSLAAILSLEVLPPRRQQTLVCGSTLPVGLSAGRHLPLSEEALLSGSDPWNTGFEGRSMHTLAVASIFGLLVISHSAAAQDRKPQPAGPEASPPQATTGQESDAQAAERKKTEELAKARQRRMDRLSRSICTGC
jgi:hypothetical protein